MNDDREEKFRQAVRDLVASAESIIQQCYRFRRDTDGLLSAIEKHDALVERLKTEPITAPTELPCECGHEWHDRGGCLVINCPCPPAEPVEKP